MNRLNILNILVALIIFIAAIVYYASYYNTALNLSDEGYLCYGAQRVLDGQLPGKDFHGYMPGRYMLVSILFKCFGTSIAVERLMFLIMRACIAVLLFFLARQIMPVFPAIIPAIVVTITPGPWHKSIEGLLFVLISLALVRYLKRKNRTSVLVLGLTSGLAFFFRTEIGLFGMGFSILLFTWFALIDKQDSDTRSTATRLFSWGKHIAIFILCFVLALLPYIILLIVRSSLVDTVYFYFHEFMTVYFQEYSTAITARETRQSFLGNFPGPGTMIRNFNISRTYFIQIFYYLPVIFICLSVFYLIRQRLRNIWTVQEYILSIIVIIAGFNFNSLIIATDISHLLQCIPLPLILGSFLMTRVYSFLTLKLNTRNMHNTAKLVLESALILFLISLPVLYLTVILTGDRAKDYYIGSFRMKPGNPVAIASVRAHIYADRELAHTVNSILQYVKTNVPANENMLCLFYEPMFYFLSGKHNTTRYDGFFPHTVGTPDRQHEIIRQIKEKHITTIIASELMYGSPKYPQFELKKYAPVFHDYIMSHFQTRTRIGQFYIMNREIP